MPSSPRRRTPRTPRAACYARRGQLRPQLPRGRAVDESERLARETADAIFGPMRSMLDQVDSASAATLLEDHEKVSVYAALCGERGALLELRGKAGKARGEHRRALELHLEATRRAPEVSDRARAAIVAWRGKVDETRLAAGYRSMLEKLG